MLVLPKGFRMEGVPTVAPDISRAISEWFGQWNRSCEVKWIPHANCFAALVSLKPDDPLLGAWNAGELSGEREPTEDVFFHEPNPDYTKGAFQNGKRVMPYRALDLNELGVTGTIEFLERGNTFSGRGEFSSVSEAVKYARDKGHEGYEKLRAEKRNEVIDMAMDVRRQVEGIPLLPVGIDLTPPARDA